MVQQTNSKCLDWILVEVASLVLLYLFQNQINLPRFLPVPVRFVMVVAEAEAVLVVEGLLFVAAELLATMKMNEKIHHIIRSRSHL